MSTVANAFFLARAYLRERALATALNVMLLALGVGTIIALLLTLHEAETRMERDSAGIDLVVGAKGSPLQMVLSSVFALDVPTGNIPMREAAALLKNPLIKRAVPLALGDSYRAFRIVGTEPAYTELYGAKPNAGRLWQQPLEVVLGATVARESGLRVGAKFAGAHGLGTGGGTHDTAPFEVVGILAETGAVIDRLILTSVESIWLAHDHADASHTPDTDDPEDEVTAYLVQYASPIAAASFPRRVNASSSLQAASPALETARLFALLGVGISTFKVFAAIMMIAAALGIFVGLMSALNTQLRDLALLRVLGATPATVFLTLIMQGLMLGLMGVILGVVLGHVGAYAISLSLAAAQQVPVAGFKMLAAEFWVALSALGLGLLAALYPAWRAYHRAAPQTLAEP